MTTNRDGDPAQPGGAARTEGTDDPTLQLLAEEVSVAKETLETGRVRISTRTYHRDALVDENLAREHVEIEKVPVGVRIYTVPEVRQEGDTTIVPVVEEVLVVERQLMLKEEVRIRRVRTTERHQEKVTLRHQEAVVTQQQDDTGKADTTLVAGLGQTKLEGG